MALSRPANRALFAALALLLCGLVVWWTHEACNPRVSETVRIVRSRGVCGPFNDLTEGVRAAPGRFVHAVAPMVGADPASRRCEPPWVDSQIRSLAWSTPYEQGWLTLEAESVEDQVVVRWSATRDDMGPHQDEATWREELGPAEARVGPDLLVDLLQASADTNCDRSLPDEYMLHCDCSASLSFRTEAGDDVQVEMVLARLDQWVTRVRDPDAIVPWGDLTEEDEKRVDAGDLGFAGQDPHGRVQAAAAALRDAALAAGPEEGREWRSVNLPQPPQPPADSRPSAREVDFQVTPIEQGRSLHKTARRYHGRMRDCAAAHPSPDPGQPFSVALAWVADPDGTVGQVEVLESSSATPELLLCLQEVVGRMRLLPAPDVRLRVERHEILFEPAPR